MIDWLTNPRSLEELKAAAERQFDTPQEALSYAIGIIHNYEIDIRQRGYDKDGFCQGVVYVEALPLLRAALKRFR